MSERQGAAHAGLPWPESYEELRPLLRERWGISDEIYLNSQLSGRSGALVYAVDVTSPDYTGQAILKLDQASDPEGRTKSEEQRHQEACQRAPTYAAAHIPRLLHTLHQGDSVAMLYSIAGHGLEYVIPWAECAYHRQLTVVRLTSRELLEDWNRDYTVAPGLHLPQDLLYGWLGDRLDPAKNRLHHFLAERSGLTADAPSFTIAGRWYPNPLAFAANAATLPDRLLLRAIIGNVHGDLHGFNLLVGGSDRTRDGYYLIDFARFQDRQFLFYDHAYLTLSHLLAERQHASPANWLSILDHLSPLRLASEPDELRGDDVGLVDLIAALQQALTDWVDDHESNRLSYMQAQSLLAGVAVGLKLANAPLADKLRCMAFVYAAANLRDYLRLYELDWSASGPSLDIERDIPPPGGSVPVAHYDTDVREPSLPEKPTVVVLAFDNLTGDPKQELFSDGVAEEIITVLSRTDWLNAVSRASSFAYKGQAIDAKRIGRELGAHYIVEGSVRKAGSRVRIAAQLTDAESGHSLWAERFDRHLDDVLTLQDDIAEAIVGHIDWELKVAEQTRAHLMPVRVSGYDTFENGMWHFYRYTEEDSNIAKEELHTTIAKLPDYAVAYAALTLLETRSITFGTTCSPEEALQRAHGLAVKAVELDEHRSMARTALARVLTLQGDHDRAIEEAEVAIDLNSSFWYAHFALAKAHLAAGRPVDALPAFERCVRLGPPGHFLKARQVGLAFCHYLAGNPAEAERFARPTVYGSLTGFAGRLVLAAALVQQDQRDEARATVSDALRIRPDLTLAVAGTLWLGLIRCELDKVLGDLKTAGVPA